MEDTAMIKTTQRELKGMVRNGIAIDVTNAGNRSAIPESYDQIGYAAGIYGCNGMLLKGCKTGQLYAVTARSSAIYTF